jgi:hypothetical protein
MHRNRHDWAETFAVAKCAVLILALLAAYLGLGGCVIAPYGGYGPGYYPHYYHDGYYRGGYGQGGYGGYGY